MSSVLVVLHVVVCIFMIAVILLQRGKGAEIGAVFGGGASSTVFGSRGAGNFLTKLTTASAVVFMLTSLSLAYLWDRGGEDALFESEGAAEAAAGVEDAFEEVGTVPAEALPADAPDAAGETPSAP